HTQGGDLRVAAPAVARVDTEAQFNGDSTDCSSTIKPTEERFTLFGFILRIGFSSWPFDHHTRPYAQGVATTTGIQAAEGKLYLCAVKDVFAGRIVGYSIDSRMTSRLAVNALNNAVALRGNVAGCVVHSDRGSQFRSRKFVRALKRHGLVGSMGRVGAAGDNA